MSLEGLKRETDVDCPNCIDSKLWIIEEELMNEKCEGFVCLSCGRGYELVGKNYLEALREGTAKV